MLKIVYTNVNAITADEFKSLLPYVSEERRLFLQGCKSEKYRNESLVGEVLARKLISEETGLEPSSLVFLRSKTGKPYVDIEKVYFNISHSKGYVCAAISNEELGVDLQKIAEIRPGVEKQILSKNEMDIYLSLEQEKRACYLSRIWCEKESYYKYLGTGIDRRPSETDLTLVKKEVNIQEYSITPEYFLAVCKQANEGQNDQQEQIKICEKTLKELLDS